MTTPLWASPGPLDGDAMLAEAIERYKALIGTDEAAARDAFADSFCCLWAGCFCGRGACDAIDQLKEMAKL